MDQFLYKTDMGDRNIEQGDPIGEESKLLFPAGHGYVPKGDQRESTISKPRHNFCREIFSMTWPL
jgi:hypothetical protein